MRGPECVDGRVSALLPETTDAPHPAVLLYCRPGFEDECAKEISALAKARSIAGHVRARPNAGFVEYLPDDSGAARTLCRAARWRSLVFARQLICTEGWLRTLPPGDRVEALLPLIASAHGPFSALWLETADTNEAKELAAFCRKFRVPLAAALVERGLLDETDATLPRLHLFFTGSAAACVGTSHPDNSSPWPMGIPRLRMPGAAPSRSTLKLAEAIQHWLPDGAEREWLHEGVTAVDLGAAPGGWTWQFVQRGVQVTAVDNGPMDTALMKTGLVEHVRTDGFRYRPRSPVGWMVCDMVEQPKRVAALVGGWLAGDWCARCIFNLKLPMKQRYLELERCRVALLERCAETGTRWRIEFRQLYHDREEVTGYAVREPGSSAAGRRKKAPPRTDQAGNRTSRQGSRRGTGTSRPNGRRS
jgi:23S rRNA (cytidine2498-2'-O)-methyltransferase